MARKIGEPARTRSRKSSYGRADPVSKETTETPAARKSRARKNALESSLSKSATVKGTPRKGVAAKRTRADPPELKNKAEPAAAVKSATKEDSKAVSRIATRILAGKLMPTLEQVRALAMSVLGQDKQTNHNRDKAKGKGKRKAKGKGKSKK